MMDIMNADQIPRVREHLALRRFATLTDEEIGEFLKASPKALQMALGRYKEDCSEAERREIEAYRPPSRNQAPTVEELKWRFEHQSPEQIYARFANSINLWWSKLAVALEVPPEFLEILRSHGISDTIRRIGEGYVVSIGTLTIEAPTQEIAEAIDLQVRLWSSTEEIPDEGWGKVKMRCIGLVSTLVALNNTDRAGRDRNELASALRKFEEPLGFPQRGAKDAAEYLRYAIESAPDYLAQEGYKETVVCGLCGTYVPVYLSLYRAVIDMWRWSLSVVRETHDPDEALPIAREFLSRWTTFPFLQRELRDIGMAWSHPLLRHLVDLHNEHPEWLPKRRVYDIAAEVFGVSPAAFDERVPVSPLNRVVEIDGTVKVMDPAI